MYVYILELRTQAHFCFLVFGWCVQGVWSLALIGNELLLGKIFRF